MRWRFAVLLVLLGAWALAPTVTAATPAPCKGCQVWAVSVHLIDPGTKWKVDWGTARVTVGPSGKITSAGPVGGKWVGHISAFVGTCTQGGHESIPASDFHYTLRGTRDGTGFTLIWRSADGVAQADVPKNPACHALVELANQVSSTFIQGPLTVPIDAKRAATSARADFGPAHFVLRRVSAS